MFLAPEEKNVRIQYIKYVSSFVFSIEKEMKP